ncbi:nuclear cap binding complex subunit [Phytophthora pseudosyringae]|uniref:Nuclear cap binding complex subunit n=1 Tax=Phytophthora pseudosyringae TaxID=221518 RepID=A0A8T1VA44_9STRA|nr:nuclear cap binding complex subunit [Phytophthora pseudosyringae]
MPLHCRFLLCCVALVALALVSKTDAAACTSTQVVELSALSSNVTAVCGSDALSSTTTAYCDDSSCLAYLTSMTASVPSCEVESYNLRTVLTSAISSCNAASDAVPASKSSAQWLHHAPPWTAALLLLHVVVVLGLASDMF